MSTTSPSFSKSQSFIWPGEATPKVWRHIPKNHPADESDAAYFDILDGNGRTIVDTIFHGGVDHLVDFLVDSLAQALDLQSSLRAAALNHLDSMREDELRAVEDTEADFATTWAPATPTALDWNR
jgi:hypothetical protein